jgi:hypothetical protein
MGLVGPGRVITRYIHHVLEDPVEPVDGRERRSPYGAGVFGDVVCEATTVLVEHDECHAGEYFQP